MDLEARSAFAPCPRRTRAIPTAIRRALLSRDRHCRFPGCANQSFLHGHHVHHWLHGGRTAEVWTPDGRRLPATPALVPDPGTIDWLEGAWDPRGGSSPSIDGPLPLPIWDGEPPDYEAAVDAMIVG